MPDDDSLFSRYKAEYARGNFACGLLLLQKYISGQPRRRAYYDIVLADCLRMIGRFRESEAVYRSVPAVDQSAVFHFSIAQTYIDMLNVESAEFHLRKSIELEPNSTVPYIMLSGVLTSKGDLKGSREILEKGLSAEGDRDEVCLNLAKVCRALGNFEDAIKYYRSALDLCPDYEGVVDELNDVVKAQALTDQIGRID